MRALPDNSGFESLYTMEREEGEMEIDTIDNGLSTTVGSIASHSASSAPSVAASDITTTSFAPSVAAPSTSNHASAAISTTSALTRGKGSHKRVPPSKNAMSTIGAVPISSSASRPSEWTTSTPELVAASDSGNDKDVNSPSNVDGPTGDNESGGGGRDQDDEGRDRVKDNEGRGGGDDAWSSMASPISGLHPMFDLPPSPLPTLGDLPPSRFGSMEPEVIQVAPSNLSSVPITVAGLNDRLTSHSGAVEPELT